jgi:hypothetical protein
MTWSLYAFDVLEPSPKITTNVSFVSDPNQIDQLFCLQVLSSIASICDQSIHIPIGLWFGSLEAIRRRPNSAVTDSGFQMEALRADHGFARNGIPER